MPVESRDLAERLSSEGFGEAAALRELLPLVYVDLKRIAHHQLFRQVPGATLSTTVLVHETYARLARDQGRAAPTRTHFISLCARVMRQIVIDHARARAAAKRGGGEAALELLDSDSADPSQVHVLLGFVEALDALAAADARLARMIEQHWFLGMEPDELASLHGVTLRTVQRELKRARAWIGELLLP
jgi:RNA polymerase sigma factor (TIGR02999 family)